MAGTLRRVGASLLVAVLVCVTLALAALFWLVRGQGWLVQTVATGSMEPTIPTGSIIVSRPADPGDIEVGDVIVFRSPTGATFSGGDDGVFEATESMLITHRVVAVEGAGDLAAFRTRGDGNAEQDPWEVTAPMLRARYVAHVPGVGGFLALPGMRRGMFLAVAAIGCVVIVTETRSLVRELRSRRPGADEPLPVTGETAAAARSASLEES